MFEYPARDEPTTRSSSESEWVDGAIKMCMKCTRFIERECKSSGTVFFSMFTHNLVDIMQREYNLYSQQKERRLGIDIDKMDALTLLGIMLLSGYNRLPYNRLYWSEWADIQKSLVSDSPRRSRLDEIVSDLYFRDNTNLSGDRWAYSKVRPKLEELIGAFKQADVVDDISIDETMIPYLDKHGLKQFIREKPIQLSFLL